MKDTEDIYVVRVYRREEKNPCRVTGIVEEAANGIKKGFNTIDDLASIIAVSGPPGENKENKTAGYARQAGRLELKLPVLVKGKNGHGKPFDESTSLSDISPKGAGFFLRTPVSVDAVLTLTIDPDHSNLNLKARVIRIEKGEKELQIGAVFLHEKV